MINNNTEQKIMINNNNEQTIYNEQNNNDFFNNNNNNDQLIDFSTCLPKLIIPGTVIWKKRRSVPSKKLRFITKGPPAKNCG